MLSTAKHAAKLSESSRACSFKGKNFSQLISTSNLHSNNTEYKIREFLHLHKGKYCVFIFIDKQIE